jgi:type II secretory pathway pseudopilin PulG
LGTTLIEMMVTVALVSFVMALVFQTLLGFRALTQATHLRRQTAATARQALRFLEQDLQGVGYGIEPALALDFSVYQGSGAYCGPGPGGDVAASTCPALRDRIDGPDELVFYARNPGYWGGDLGGAPEGKAWSVLSASGTALTLEAHGGEYFGRGQLLQLGCSGGARHAYVRVSGSVSLGVAGANPVPLEAVVPGDPFTQSADSFMTDCGSVARAFLVDRFRYYVDPAVVLADGSTGSFLMLDRGVDRNGDDALDAEDLIPIAPGIVDLQVSYVRPEPALVEVGASSGTALGLCNLGSRPPNALAPCAGGLGVVQFSAGAGAADYEGFGYLNTGGALRQAPHAANVAAVHVALVARSTSRSEGLQSQPLLLNRSELPGSALNQPFSYSTAESAVSTPNLQARGLSFL